MALSLPTTRALGLFRRRLRQLRERRLILSETRVFMDTLRA